MIQKTKEDVDIGWIKNEIQCPHGVLIMRLPSKSMTDDEIGQRCPKELMNRLRVEKCMICRDLFGEYLTYGKTG